jgi:hypothetical protein
LKQNLAVYKPREIYILSEVGGGASMTSKCLPIVLKELMREVKTRLKDKRAYYLETLSMVTITHYPEIRRITRKCRQSVEDELEAIYDIYMTETTDHSTISYIDLANLRGHYFIRESLD